MEAPHRLQQRRESIAVPLVEQRGEFVECVCRELFEFVGLHVVLPLNGLAVGSFARTEGPRQPGGRTRQRGRAERRGDVSGRASGLLLARSEAADEPRRVRGLHDGADEESERPAKSDRGRSPHAEGADTVDCGRGSLAMGHKIGQFSSRDWPPASIEKLMTGLLAALPIGQEIGRRSDPGAIF